MPVTRRMLVRDLEDTLLLTHYSPDETFILEHP